MPTLEFKGKPFVYSHHLSVPFRELVIDAEKSLPVEGASPSMDENLIIHGDNLEALKALLPRYAGKVDVIYIDPPYNTGNEGWAYNDNVNAPALKAWLGKVVDAEDLERHDKWLCMMWPRLQMLWELLSDTGVLAVSLNDDEQHRFRAIMDEIASPSAFLGVVVWKTRNTDNRVKTMLSQDHEYVSIFSKGAPVRGRKIDRSDFRSFDKERDDYYVTDPLTGKATEAERPNLHYKITNPDTGDVYDPDPSRGWITDEPGLLALLADKRIWWPPDPAKGKPRKKRFLGETSERMPASTFWADTRTQTGADELDQIMGKRMFSFPKASDFMKRVLDLIGGSDAVILDSFAGSGTTAHAALALNKLDGGSRKFILIETEDYADTLTAERMRRVIKGVPGAKDDALKAGFGGGFTYCDLGEPMDLERFFAGEGAAPGWEQVARYVAYTATGETLAPAEGEDGFAGYAGPYRLHLLYRPNGDWMRSNEAMLDLTTAERIAEAAKADGNKPVLVFAAGKLMGQRTLTDIGLTFCQLPYSVHRILGDGAEGVAGVDAA